MAGRLPSSPPHVASEQLVNSTKVQQLSQQHLPPRRTAIIGALVSSRRLPMLDICAKQRANPHTSPPVLAFSCLRSRSKATPHMAFGVSNSSRGSVSVGLNKISAQSKLSATAAKCHCLLTASSTSGLWQPLPVAFQSCSVLCTCRTTAFCFPTVPVGKIFREHVCNCFGPVCSLSEGAVQPYVAEVRAAIFTCRGSFS